MDINTVHMCLTLSLQVNTTSEDGCSLYTCGVNSRGDLVLQTKVTTCPPFNRQACLDQGVRVLPLHPSISQHSHTYTSVLNPPLLFVFREKSARSEQPAVRCVSRAVPPARLKLFWKSDFNVCVCMLKVLNQSVRGHREYRTTSKWMAANQSSR